MVFCFPRSANLAEFITPVYPGFFNANVNIYKHSYTLTKVALNNEQLGRYNQYRVTNLSVVSKNIMITSRFDV